MSYVQQILMQQHRRDTATLQTATAGLPEPVLPVVPITEVALPKRARRPRRSTPKDDLRDIKTVESVNVLPVHALDVSLTTADEVAVIQPTTTDVTARDKQKSLVEVIDILLEGINKQTTSDTPTKQPTESTATSEVVNKTVKSKQSDRKKRIRRGRKEADDVIPCDDPYCTFPDSPGEKHEHRG